MQPSQVKERFGSIEQSIHNAALLCQITSKVPDDLRDRVSELDRETDQAKQLLEREVNDKRILQCVDHLKELGDRAMQTCNQAGNTVDPKVQTAVREAHDAISNLQHRLH